MSTVDSIGSSGATGAAQSNAPTGAMDREAFLKLLVAQISHQDPLQPMEGTEFVTQLAQFTAVEQALAQSQKLDLLSMQLTGMANADATALVGKTVTVRGKGIAFDGVTPTGASVTLEGPAAKVTVRIKDAEGHVVRTMDYGAKPSGALPVSWDGKTDDGTTAKAGAYTVEVEATDADGKAVATSQDVTGVVTKVTYDKGYPELVLDSGATAPVSDLVSVAETKKGR